MKNPWLEIPASDYESHMDLPYVDQSSFINKAFKDTLENHNASLLAYLGCATGNGLEHIDSRVSKRVHAIDINPEYLEILRQRYQNAIPGLEITQTDLKTFDAEPENYALIFAGLVFEYLSPEPLVKKIYNWLKHGGIFKVILQLPAENQNKVSDTPYKSLQKLHSIMNLVPENRFRDMAGSSGLVEIDRKQVDLKAGKSFYLGTWGKPG